MQDTRERIESMDELTALASEARTMTIWSVPQARVLHTRTMAHDEQEPHCGGYVLLGTLWHYVEGVKETERGLWVEVGRGRRHDPRKPRPTGGLHAHTLRNRKRRKAGR